MDADSSTKTARCPDCDWTLSTLENTVRSLAQLCAELEHHLKDEHRWDDKRAHEHAREWALSAVDDQTA